MPNKDQLMNEEVKETKKEDFKGKGTRSNSHKRRGNGKGNSKPRNGYDKKSSNDISWHSKSDTLLNAAAAIPWSWATGSPVELNSNGLTTEKGTFHLPGICAVRTVSVPGVGNKFTDAVNIGARALYTDIRRQLKSANAYEASDVMMYIIACGEIQEYITWFTRLYATTPLYSFMNSFTPDALIKMQGVDPKDLHERATEFRSRVNQLIYKASQIWMPKGFDYVSRCKWLYAGYYCEGESIKDQIYMFTPGMFRKFEYDPEADYAGSLQAYIPIPAYTDDDHLLTVDSLCNYLDDMIESLVTDSDFQNIAGDLFNCYGSNGVETFSLIPEDAITYPVFDEEVLEQIQNARCLTTVAYAFENFEDYLDTFSVKQDEANNVMVVASDINIDLTSVTGTEKTRLRNGLLTDSFDNILSVHKDPSPAKTMLITRLTNHVKTARETDTDKFKVSIDAAAELVLSIEMAYLNPNNRSLAVVDHDTNGIQYLHSPSHAEFGVGTLTFMRNFHYYPNLITHKTDGIPHYSRFGEMDITAPITAMQLEDLNRIDLMSLFAVPDVGKVNK